MKDTTTFLILREFRKKTLLFSLLIIGLINGINAQTVYTFTTCGAIGPVGPTQVMANSTYGPTTLSGLVTVTSGIQYWTVPTTGLYSIETRGAQGTNSGGLGSSMKGQFTLTAGQVLKILVGQQGVFYSSTSAGGGGGSFVTFTNNVPLIVSGGGGGRAQSLPTSAPGIDASITTTGNDGYSGLNGLGAPYSTYIGFGGVLGSGATGSTPHAGNGGGFNTSGANGQCGTPGIAFISGGAGAGASCTGASGGFGGGGGGGNSGGGGGGGYSGGGGSYHNPTNGGGGGSYNSGTNQVNTAGANSGNGSVIITKLAGVSINQTASILCNGQLTAILTASAVGGTAPYTYSWSPGGSTSQTLTGLGAGTYTCVSTDAASITYTASFTITQPTAFTSTLVSQTNLTCNGAGNGQLSVSASGGIPAYTYNWSPGGGSAATATGLSAGIYTCTIQDANNCVSIKTATVTEPPPTAILGFATSPVVCSGQTTILLGAAALTYTWTGGAVNGVAFAPPATAVYTVTGTNAAGCNGTATVGITVNALPTLAITGTSLICTGSGATLSVSGANTYTWSDSSNGTSLIANPLSTTSYTVTGTNSNGCTNTAVKTVTVLGGLPVVTANTSSPSVCIGKNTTLYGGGAASYVWSGGVTDNVPFAPGISGIYTVTGTNICGSATNTILIIVNSLPNIVANATSTSICIGGTAFLTGSGGVSYSWSGGVTNGNTFLPSVTNTYTVTGTDGNGCQNTDTKQIVVNPLPNITANVTNSIVCLGNTTTLFGGGGASYTWSGGVTNNAPFTPGATSTYIVTGTDINGCQNTASKTVTVINVPALTVSATFSSVCSGNSTNLSASGALSYVWTGGVTNNVTFVPSATTTYTVYGTNSCGTTSSAITVTVNALPNITANATNTSICIGGPVTLSGGGGISYSWTGGITNGNSFSPGTTSSYTVTGTDVNGCQNTASKTIVVNALPNITANVTSSIVCLGNTTTLFGGGGASYSWSGGITNNSPFAPGSTNTYTVTGTDVNGCQNTATKSVTVINVPALVVSATNPSICLGNSTILSASGALSYAWTNGVINNAVFSPTITNTYTVYGTNTCGTTSNVITVTVNALPIVTANASNSVACIGTPITLFGGGANTYTWSNGIINNLSFIPAITTTYSVTGTDANGCQNVAFKTLTVLSLPTVSASASNTAFCYGNSTILNGGGAVTYTWTGGILNNVAFTPSITTTYTVTGTGANGCQNTAVKTITVYQLPVVVANVTNSVICSSNSTSFYGSGANTYTWSGSITNGALLFPTSSATYSVSGTNTLTGCTSTNIAFASVTVNALPSITLTPSSPSVCAGQTVSINASGANTYTFTGGISNGLPFTPGTTTSYFVTGKNTLTGCSNIAQQIITVNAHPVVSGSVSTSMICPGDPVTFTGSGANTYTWTGGVTNGLPFFPTNSMSFTVTGTNTLTGCTSTNIASQFVTVNLAPTLLVTVSNSAVCEGDNTTISVFGANAYTISNNVINTVPFTPTVSATYTITGLNTSTGCSAIATRTINVNPNPIVGFSGSAPSVCFGNSTTLSGSGANTYTLTGGIFNGVAFTPTITNTYSITGTNTLTGCKSTNIASITVIVNSLPVVSSTVSASVICEGTPVTFNGSGADTYTWTNGPIDGIPFSPILTGTYSVSGTDTLTGCTSTNSSVQSVTVEPAPVVSVASSNNGTICIGETTTLTANGTGTISWNTGESDTYIVVTPSVTTNYTVTLTGINGCSKSVDITQNVADCTGLASYSQNENSILSIYPNPSNGSFTIKGINNLNLSLMNELGQTVKTISLNELNEQTVNVENLPAGIYFVTGHQDKQFVKQKIVIAR